MKANVNGPDPNRRELGGAKKIPVNEESYVELIRFLGLDYGRELRQRQ
jgi:hypothetical protein